MPEKFKGTGVAVITPFHESGHIDFASFELIIEHLISNGISYIVALGTTGESVTLSKDEKVAVINFVSDIIGQRVPLVIGLGGNNTQDIINNIKSLSFESIDAILSVCPRSWERRRRRRSPGSKGRIGENPHD